MYKKMVQYLNRIMAILSSIHPQIAIIQPLLL